MSEFCFRSDYFHVMKILTTFCVFLAMRGLSADISLVVTCEPNAPLVSGSTYRLYAMIPLDASLHVVYGDTQNPLQINASNGFYQHPLGANTSSGIHPALISQQNELRADSWITIGYENQIDNNLWDVGLELIPFSQGGNIFCDNGGWFLVPTDQRSMPNQQGLVLLGQFTSTGIVSGVLNLQGRDANGVWTRKGLSFSSENCLIPGCTDTQFSNYNPSAQINDGSCIGERIYPAESAPVGGDGWSVFPNPLRQNLIHIQFNGFQFPLASTGQLEIRDATGKVIVSRVIQSENLILGNRLTIEQDLSAGVYEVILHQGKYKENKKLVVQK